MLVFQFRLAPPQLISRINLFTDTFPSAPQPYSGYDETARKKEIGSLKKLRVELRKNEEEI